MGAMAVQAPVVQASSLANIIALADAPPPRPTPRLRGGKSLELYIARVPGSRDIFLTTLKPRDKVVTAQDIENCLYYCHLETETDDLFRHEEDYFGESVHDGESHESDVAPSPTSQTEPISPTSRVRAPSLPPLPERQLEYNDDTGIDAPILPPRPKDSTTPKAIKRKPIKGSPERSKDVAPSSSAIVSVLPPRPISEISNLVQLSLNVPARPLGPRPLSERRQSENIGVHVHPIQTNDSTNVLQEQKSPFLPRRPVSMLTARSHYSEQRQLASGNGNSPYIDSQIHSYSSFAQPSTLGKENVGNERWHNPTHPPQERSSQPPPVPAHTFDTTPYPSASPRPGSLSPPSTASSRRRSNSLVSNIPAGFEHTKSAPHTGFNVTLIRRNPATSTQSNVGKISVPATGPSHYKPASKVLLQIFNPGYNHFRQNPENDMPLTTSSLVRCLSEDDDCTFSTDLRLATRRRSIKSPSTPYFGDVPVNQLISVSPSQPYSFLGPWNRVCEFGTGVRGKSLKCRHMLGTGFRMNSQGAHGTDGHENARSGRSDARKEPMSIVDLSELRFNTPSTGLFAKSKQQDRRPRTGSAVGNFGMKSPTSQTGFHGIHRKSVPMFGSNHGQPPALPPRDGQLQAQGPPLPPRDAQLHHQYQEHQHQHHPPFPSRDSHDSTTSPSAFTSALHSPSHFEPPYQDQDLDQDQDIEPMDLSLGQERAGGGFKGNKAKLGKLVIEPEGLEMLDLLVAANMGVWWSIR